MDERPRTFQGVLQGICFLSLLVSAHLLASSVLVAFALLLLEGGGLVPTLLLRGGAGGEACIPLL